jgi:hypothetical protein
MTAAAFDQEFERLIIELSLVSREIRRKGAHSTPGRRVKVSEGTEGVLLARSPSHGPA